MGYGSVSSKISVKALTKNTQTDMSKIKTLNTELEEIDYSTPLGDFNGNIDYGNISKDGFTVQGMSRVGDEMYISAYSHDENSRLYVYDLETGKYEGYIILDNGAHVGGTTFDSENEVLYVTGSNGVVNAYDYIQLRKLMKYSVDTEDGMLVDLSEDNPEITDVSKVVIKYKPESAIDNDFKFITEDGKVTISDIGAAATTYYYNNKLYVATFEGRHKGEMRVYDVKVEEDIYGTKSIVVSNDYDTIEMPPRVQGIAITEYNGQQYLVTTESVGIASSKIEVYLFDGENTEFVSSKLYPKGLEGIYVDSDNTIMAVYENSKTEPLSTSMEELLNPEFSFGEAVKETVNEPISYIGGTVYDLGTDKKFKTAGKYFGQIGDDWSSNYDKYGGWGIFPSAVDTVVDVGCGIGTGVYAGVEFVGTVAWDGVCGLGGLIADGFMSIFG